MIFFFEKTIRHYRTYNKSAKIYLEKSAHVHVHVPVRVHGHGQGHGRGRGHGQMDTDRDMDVDVDMGRWTRTGTRTWTWTWADPDRKWKAWAVIILHVNYCRRRFVRRCFVTRRRFVTETFCRGDVLFWDVLSRRRFVRRRFVCASLDYSLSITVPLP
jgi:hypothetical protein